MSDMMIVGVNEAHIKDGIQFPVYGEIKTKDPIYGVDSVNHGLNQGNDKYVVVQYDPINAKRLGSCLKVHEGFVVYGGELIDVVSYIKGHGWPLATPDTIAWDGSDVGCLLD